MEAKRVCMRNAVCILLLLLAILIISVTHCDAERAVHLLQVPKQRKSLVSKASKKLKMIKHFDFNPSLDSSNTVPYSVDSPFSLPPFDSLPPYSYPENSPPFCVYPPNTPQTPSTVIPYTPPYYYIPPTLPNLNPPPGPSVSGSVPSPPSSTLPGPPNTNPYSPQPVLSPPFYVPGPPGPSMSPPYFEPSPPSFVPSPTGFIPSPPIFEPPVVFPPPRVPPPPPGTEQGIALWCVAKPSVPDPIIQEAMNYACASGADCASILPQGTCFQPNTLIAHASYAFNSYWQRTKVARGTCDFGGTAMLVAVDPSYDGCRFLYL